jgi:sigma-E factor negative regulatory protein RseC
MEQIVKVRQVHPDGSATVVHVRESACSGDCHKCSGCGAAKETVVFRAEDQIGCRAGDVVIVSSQTGPVLRAAAVLYVLPMALFFLGYLLGALLWSAGALAGGIAFLLGIVLVVVYDRKVAGKENTVYTITGFARDRILGSVKKGDNDLD